MLHTARKLFIDIQIFVIAICAVFSCGAAAGEGKREKASPGQAAPKGVAVISFAVLPDRDEDSWIGAGVAESVSAKLAAANFPSMRVYERAMMNRALKMEGVSQSDVREDNWAAVEKAAGALSRQNYDHVVLGTVQVVAGATPGESKIEVTARVVDAAGKAQIAASVVVADTLKNIFALETKLALKLVELLKIDTSGGDPAAMSGDDFRDLDTYRGYMMGVAMRERGDLEGAIKYFEAAKKSDRTSLLAKVAWSDTMDELAEARDKASAVGVDEAFRGEWEDRARKNVADSSVDTFNLGKALLSNCRTMGRKEKCGEAIREFTYFVEHAPVKQLSAWRLRLHNYGVTTTPGADGKNIYVAGDGGLVESVSLSERKTVWSRYAAAGMFFWTKTVVEGGIVYAASTDGTIYALSAESGDTVWSYTTGGELNSAPVIEGGELYVPSKDGNIYVLSPGDGKLLRKIALGGPTWSAPVFDGGRMFVGCSDKGVYALGAKDGGLIWKFMTGGEVWADPLLYRNRIYVGSQDTYFYALDAKDGKELWKFKAEGYIAGGAAAAGGNVIVASIDGGVYALDAETGKLAWKYQTLAGIESVPFVLGDTVYMGAYDSYVYALDAATGNPRWKYKTGGRVYSKIAALDGMLYFVSADGMLHALPVDFNPETGLSDVDGKIYIAEAERVSGNTAAAMANIKDLVANFGNYEDAWAEYAKVCADAKDLPCEFDALMRLMLDFPFSPAHIETFPRLRELTGLAWRFDTIESVGAPPLVAGENVYVATNRIAAVDKVRGKFVAAKKFEPFIENGYYWSFGTSEIAAGGGGVFVGSANRKLQAYDADTLEPKWSLDTGGWVIGQPAVVGDRVYAASRDGFLYAVEIGTGNEVWRFNARSEIISGPAAAGDTLYIYTAKGILYGVSAVDGSRVFRDEVEGVTVGPKVNNGRIVMSQASGTMYILDPKSAEPALRIDAASESVIDMRWLDKDVLFTTALWLMALDPDNDYKLKWSYSLPGGFVSAPVVYRDTIIIGSGTDLHGVGLADGKEKWVLPLRGKASHAPVLDGNMLYVAADLNLFAVDLDRLEASAAAGNVWWKVPAVSAP